MPQAASQLFIRLGVLVLVEDLLWVLWALLGNLVQPLIPEAAVPSIILVAGGLFWLCALCGQQVASLPLSVGPGARCSRATSRRGRRAMQQDVRHGKTLLVALATCAIIMDASLRALRVAWGFHMANAMVTIGLGGVMLVQHWTTGGRTWITLGARLRRLLAWPLLVVLAEIAKRASDAALGVVTRRGTKLVLPARSFGERFFYAGLTFGFLLPLFFGFFVVAPRRVAAPDEQASLATWIARFAVGLLAMVLEALLLRPVWHKLGLV